ncbi:ATP-binding cassette domain-containing protein [Haploplasma axanthum]|uniref:ABC transporter ATP-binding protein n=1 Tax=Haploplasma axanthum TaxID=29552 RepID=A0A449BBY1_HAPAX|nr:ATP-binding cassette domain-containing protein [Haploplasma axanthum]VEU79953.1 ABC transporter ATP-binding protein [Haploplasma axanthum]
MRIELIDFGFKIKKNELIETTNLSIDSGIYGLFGANGTGKSLLLKAISGDIVSTFGYVKVDNELVYENTSKMLKVLYLNEQFILLRQVFDNPMKYYENISKYIKEFDVDLAIKYLNDFEVPLKQSIDKMSLGQKACVIGVIGLATKREIILLDGIYHGMDYHVRKKYNQLLLTKKDDGGIIIVSTELKKEISVIIDYELNIKDKKIELKKFEGEE